MPEFQERSQEATLSGGEGIRGYSGAPILNDAGEVIGVFDGGYQTTTKVLSTKIATSILMLNK